MEFNVDVFLEAASPFIVIAIMLTLCRAFTWFMAEIPPEQEKPKRDVYYLDDDEG